MAFIQIYACFRVVPTPIKVTCMRKRRSTYSNDSNGMQHKSLSARQWLWCVFNRYPRAINFNSTSIDHVNDVAKCSRAIATEVKEKHDEEDQDDMEKRCGYWSICVSSERAKVVVIFDMVMLDFTMHILCVLCEYS